MNKNIKKIPLSHFHLIKKPTMNDFEYISKWLTDAYNNHKELKGYALYHNLNGFIHDAFVEHTVFVIRHKGKAVAFLTFSPPKDGIKITFRAVCVNPNFLRMGLATYLHKSAIKHYQKRGCLVAELWNVCRESYKLGISMGFIRKREKINLMKFPWSKYWLIRVNKIVMQKLGLLFGAIVMPTLTQNHFIVGH